MERGLTMVMEFAILKQASKQASKQCYEYVAVNFCYDLIQIIQTGILMPIGNYGMRMSFLLRSGTGEEGLK